MPQTLTSILVHVIFSTKERRASLKAEIRPKVFAYLGGIVARKGGRAHIVGGVDDHVHLLVKLPSSLSLADLVRTIKANSSRWMRREMGVELFAWQAGYGAFSVSRSQLRGVHRYIEGQEEHHRTRGFKEELLAFLRKNEVEFDERYLWD